MSDTSTKDTSTTSVDTSSVTEATSVLASDVEQPTTPEIEGVVHDGTSGDPDFKPLPDGQTNEGTTDPENVIKTTCAGCSKDQQIKNPGDDQALTDGVLWECSSCGARNIMKVA